MKTACEEYSGRFSGEISKIFELRKTLSLQLEDCVSLANQIIGLDKLNPLEKTVEDGLVEFENLTLQSYKTQTSVA